MLIFVVVLIAIVLTFYGLRIATDAPFLLSGTEPEPEDFGLLIASGLINFHGSLAAAFWIALSLHVLAGEQWIRTTPSRVDS